jgi:hypothetical protein
MKRIRSEIKCRKGMCGEHCCVDIEWEENERGISLCNQSYLVQMIYIYKILFTRLLKCPPSYNRPMAVGHHLSRCPPHHHHLYYVLLQIFSSPYRGCNRDEFKVKKSGVRK